MQWEILVFVIVAAVFILINIFRSGDEAPQNRRRPPLGEPARRPRNDLERFLEEIRRQKQAAAEEAQPVLEEEPTAAPPPRPVPPPRPQWVPPRPVPPPPRPLRDEPVLDVLPAVPVPPPPPPVVFTPPPPVLPPKAPPPPPGPGPAAVKPSPLLADFRALLRSPRAMQMAILLQEVLGPPRCRRHR